jgi:hypothetical protein
MSASLSTVDMPEDRAYLAHHFNCPACCAAGKTPGLQQRCTEGAALWATYEQASKPPEAPKRGPNQQMKGKRP